MALNSGSKGKSGGKGRGPPVPTSHFVEEVKELQKSDPIAKELWIAYCNEHGQGTRDPTRHTTAYLQAFLAAYEQELQGASALASHSGRGKGGGGVDEDILPEAVKIMQNRSTAFNELWREFCNQHGVKYDPVRLGAQFVQLFFDQMAQQAVGPVPPMAMQMMSGGGPVGGHPKKMRGMDGGQGQAGGGPPKRRRGMDGQAVATSAGDARKDELVNRIKAYQKADGNCKDVWVAYTDQYLSGTRDPARHSVAELETFCDVHDVREVDVGSAGKGGAEYGDPIVKDKLVNRIKAYQKSDPSCKDTWWAYSDQYLGGTRDPARHSVTELQFFCEQYQLPELVAASGGPGGWDGRMSGSECEDPIAKDQLVNRIKVFQKSDPSCKETWWAYTDQYLSGTRDPARHSIIELQEFCDEHEVPELSAASGSLGGRGTDQLQSRSRGGSSDRLKEQLVSRIKAFQKLDAGCKQAWCAYTDQHLGGTRDPARHDVADLQQFCQMHDVPESDAAVKTEFEDPTVKDDLVRRIKAFQKVGEEQKESWYGFCGSTKDPAKHDVATLETFISTFNVF